MHNTFGYRQPKHRYLYLPLWKSKLVSEDADRLHGFSMTVEGVFPAVLFYSHHGRYRKWKI